MKKIKIALVGVVLIVFCCLVLSGCQTQNAKNVEMKIAELSTVEVTLSLWENIKEIDELIAQLSEKEKESLNNYYVFEAKRAEYKKLEAEAVEEVEQLISEIPAIKKIKLASEETINNASSAYNNAPEHIQNLVSNKDVLQSAIDRLEKVKKDSWVSCTSCGGDGRTVCRLCGGRGSRLVNHTTPNGKTWRVSQECSTTGNCSVCSGRGGIYVEK